MNEGESEIDPSDGEDETLVIAQRADLIVHEPCFDEAPPAYKPPRAPENCGICIVAQCANPLIENSRWRLCNICFSVRRAFVRHQKQARLVLQDPVEEVGMLVDMPEDGDVAGPLQFSSEDEQTHATGARSALPANDGVRRVKKCRKRAVFQYLSASPSQVSKVQDTRPLSEVPAYQHFAALLTASHARLSEFNVARALPAV
ncbi:hypothetical protein GY45DRAFT_648197 [Cubamyces sp. BRFM 1775]|nr:hypothetical protein GY45DRAFT_648197 [Cubamyces sp. BRFM 1775]